MPTSEKLPCPSECMCVTATAAAPGTSWNVLDVELCTAEHGLAGGEHSSCVSSAELRALFARQPSPPSREGDDVVPLLVRAPVFARCTRPWLGLFDVVLPPLMHHNHDAVAVADEGLQQQQEELYSRSRDVAGCVEVGLGVALCAHLGTTDAAASSGVLSRLPDVAATVARTATRLLAPASDAPSLALGLTMSSSAAAPVIHPDEDEWPVRLHWSYVESSAVAPVDLDALAAHWEATVRASTACVWRASHVDALSYATPSTTEAVHRRLQTYAEQVAASELLSGGASQPSATPAQPRLCSLMAVLIDVRQRLREQEAGSNAVSCLHASAQHDALARWLLQWFLFLACADATTHAPRSEAVPFEPPIQVQTALHAVLHTHHGLVAALTALPVGSAGSPLDPLRDALQHIAQWLTLRVLEAALAQLPSKLCVHRRATLSSTPPIRETHLLFRSAGGQERTAEAAAWTVRASRACGLTPLRPSRWVRCHSAATATQPFLPELTPAQRAFVDVLERLLHVAATRPSSLDSATTMHAGTSSHELLTSTSAPLLTYDLFTRPERHAVAVCRLHCAVDKQQHRVAAPAPQRHPFVSQAAASCGGGGVAAGGVVVRAAPVASLLAWFAVDFNREFSARHRVWRLAQRYGGAAASASTAPVEAAAAPTTVAFPSVWRGLVNPSVRCDAASAATGGPALGLLGRCLLLAMWMSLSVVDVDEEPREGPVRESPSRRRVAAPWAGTIFYSSRRNVLHVRDWATAMHLARVASTLSVPSTVDSRNRHAGCGEQRAQVRAAVAGVVEAFLRACASAVQRHERWRRALLHSHPATQPRDGTPAEVARHCDVAADAADVCVLLTWSCARSPAGDAPALSALPSSSRSASMEFSVEEVAEPIREADSVSWSDRSARGPPALPGSTAAPLMDLETRLRGLLTRDAVADGVWLLRTAERLARHAWGEIEAAARQGITVAMHTAAVEAEVTSSCVQEATPAVTGASAAVETLALHADARPPPPLLATRSASPTSVNPTPPVTDAATALCSTPSLPLSLALAYAREDEAANRGCLRRVEQRHRLHLRLEYRHRSALLSLQHAETQRRALLQRVWALQEAEWQARWRTVVVPECVLRERLAEKAVAALAAARQSVRARHPVERERHAVPLRAVTMAHEAHAHRAFLLGDDSATDFSSGVKPTSAGSACTAGGPAARSPSPVQSTSPTCSLDRAERTPVPQPRTAPPPPPLPLSKPQQASPSRSVTRSHRDVRRSLPTPPPASRAREVDTRTAPVVHFSLCGVSSSCTPAVQQQQPSPATASPSPQRAGDGVCAPPPQTTTASLAWWCHVEAEKRRRTPSASTSPSRTSSASAQRTPPTPGSSLRVLRRQRRLRCRRASDHGAGGGSRASVALAVAEAVRIASAASPAAASTTAERAPQAHSHPIATTSELPLDVSIADVPRARVKIRKAGAAVLQRPLPSPATTALLLHASHAPPRRLRTSVVTWSDDVQEF